MIKNQDSIRAEMVAALKDAGGYDFIINNAHRMDKDDLARVAAECMMAVYLKLSEEDYAVFENEVAESLESDYWGIGDESEDESEDIELV